MTTADRSVAAGGPGPALRVVLLVEQLRRRVPGGIGRYITGLLQGLTEMADAGEAVPKVILHASRAPAGVDPLAGYGFELISSRLWVPALTRAWDRGLIDVPGQGDVIHALSMATPPARHASLVVTVHDLAWRTVPETFPRRGRRWHEAAFGRARRRAARLVVPSEEAAGSLVEAGVDGADGLSVTVIPHGSDHLPPPDNASADELLRRLGVDGEFLLSVGTLEPRKNLARLVEAYGRARLQLPHPWPLVVVGPTGWGDRSPAGAGAGAGDGDGADADVGGGGAAGVIAAGKVDDGTLAALYERARLLAYVPLTEGFGFPPVEAMRLGTPVVASAMPSLGGGGLVVDPERVDEISNGLVKAATDDSRRAELVAGGLERTAELTWRASARQHVALWEAVR